MLLECNRSWPVDFSTTRRKIRRHRLRATDRSQQKLPAVFVWALAGGTQRSCCQGPNRGYSGPWAPLSEACEVQGNSIDKSGVFCNSICRCIRSWYGSFHTKALTACRERIRKATPLVHKARGVLLREDGARRARKPRRARLRGMLPGDDAAEVTRPRGRLGGQPRCVTAEQGFGRGRSVSHETEFRLRTVRSRPL